MMRARRWILVAALGGAACSDARIATMPERVTADEDIIVSAPVPLPDEAARHGVSSAAGPHDEAGVTYVTLLPGVAAGGTVATIRNGATGQAVMTAVVGGGFDPVALDATVGDSIEIVIVGPVGTLLTLRRAVPARRAPVVTRSIPPHGKADVPLNSIIIVVFSEPVDAGSVGGGSLQLLQAGVPVAETVTFADSAHFALAITPAAPLAAGTSYRVVASTAIMNLAGVPLRADFASEFTTGTTPAAVVASLAIAPETATVGLGSRVQLVALTRDNQGSLLAGMPVTWVSGSESVASVTSTGLVTTVATGIANITAVAGGKAATARVTVVSGGPAIASIRISPESATIALGDSVRLTAVARDAQGRILRGAPIAWMVTDDGSVVAVDQAGLVTTRGPGNTIVGAFGGPMAGPNFGQARITVTLASVASVTVSPHAATVAILDTVRLTAVVRDARGATLRAPVSWTSSDRSVAMVDSAGLVSARASGSARITALSGSRADTTRITVPAPPVPSGLVFASISVGSNHVCGLAAGGGAWCWGRNTSGQLGDGTTSSSTTPVAVAGGHSFQSLTAGEGTSCGITTSGVAYCWGDNRYGALGNGTLKDASVPVAVAAPPGTTFSSISAGAQVTCGLASAGRAYCWGDNSAGELGDGTVGQSAHTAVPVAGGLTFASVCAGVW
jgi:uncharacterized protein YjdB